MRTPFQSGDLLIVSRRGAGSSVQVGLLGHPHRYLRLVINCYWHPEHHDFFVDSIILCPEPGDTRGYLLGQSHIFYELLSSVSEARG